MSENSYSIQSFKSQLCGLPGQCLLWADTNIPQQYDRWNLKRPPCHWVFWTININYWIKSLKKVDTLWLLRFFRIKNTCWSKIARVHHPFWDGWTWIFIDLQKGNLGGSRSHSRLSPYFHFQFPPNLPCSIYYWRSRDPDDVHHEEHQQDSPYQRSHRIGHRHHLSSRSSWHDLFFRSSSEAWKKMDNQHDVTQSCNVRWTQKNEEPLLSQPTVVTKYHAKMQCESRPTQSSPPLGTIVRSSFTNCKIRTKRMIRSNLPTHSARGSDQRVRKCAYATTKQIKIKLQATKRLGKTVNPLRHVQSCLIILRFFFMEENQTFRARIRRFPYDMLHVTYK